MLDHKQNFVTSKAPPYAESKYLIYNHVHFITMLLIWLKYKLTLSLLVFVVVKKLNIWFII